MKPQPLHLTVAQPVLKVESQAQVAPALRLVAMAAKAALVAMLGKAEQ
jgi:hypothetical protein